MGPGGRLVSCSIKVIAPNSKHLFSAREIEDTKLSTQCHAGIHLKPMVAIIYCELSPENVQGDIGALNLMA